MENLRVPVLSTRDFLKLGGLFGIGLAVPPKVINYLSPEGRDYKLEPLETQNAIYYPFFERHDRTPDIARAFENIAVVPDIQFYELMTEPANVFQAIKPGRILNGLGGTPIVNSDMRRIIPDLTLNFFHKNHVGVSYEGINFNDEFMNSSVVTMNAEFKLGSITAALFGLHRFLGLVNEKSYNKKDLLTDLAGFIPAMWLSGGTGSLFIAVEIDGVESLVKVKDALLRVGSLIEGLHPEHLNVFYRNLLMARKLQFLAETLSEKYKVRKPAISFLVGEGHLGIKDLLVLGRDFTLEGLNIYPKSLIKQAIEDNGGMNPFCSTVVISASDNSRVILKDEVLKKFLSNMVG